MPIWVDADACPKVIKEILFRAAERAQVVVTLVANQRLLVPQSTYIKMLRVDKGFDVADDEIVKRSQSGDLVITADIPLADAVIQKGCVALNPRGELCTTDNIKSRLATRNLMEQLRDIGEVRGGPSALSQADRQAFANHLDRWLTQQSK